MNFVSNVFKKIVLGDSNSTVAETKNQVLLVSGENREEDNETAETLSEKDDVSSQDRIPAENSIAMQENDPFYEANSTSTAFPLEENLTKDSVSDVNIPENCSYGSLDTSNEFICNQPNIEDASENTNQDFENVKDTLVDSLESSELNNDLKLNLLEGQNVANTSTVNPIQQYQLDTSADSYTSTDKENKTLLNDDTIKMNENSHGQVVLTTSDMNNKETNETSSLKNKIIETQLNNDETIQTDVNKYNASQNSMLVVKCRENEKDTNCKKEVIKNYEKETPKDLNVEQNIKDIKTVLEDFADNKCYLNEKSEIDDLESIKQLSKTNSNISSNCICGNLEEDSTNVRRVSEEANLIEKNKNLSLRDILEEPESSLIKNDQNIKNVTDEQIESICSENKLPKSDKNIKPRGSCANEENIQSKTETPKILEVQVSTANQSTLLNNLSISKNITLESILKETSFNNTLIPTIKVSVQNNDNHNNKISDEVIQTTSVASEDLDTKTLVQEFQNCSIDSNIANFENKNIEEMCIFNKDKEDYIKFERQQKQAEESIEENLQNILDCEHGIEENYAIKKTDVNEKHVSLKNTSEVSFQNKKDSENNVIEKYETKCAEKTDVNDIDKEHNVSSEEKSEASIQREDCKNESKNISDFDKNTDDSIFLSNISEKDDKFKTFDIDTEQKPNNSDTMLASNSNQKKYFNEDEFIVKEIKSIEENRVLEKEIVDLKLDEDSDGQDKENESFEDIRNLGSSLSSNFHSKIITENITDINIDNNDDQIEEDSTIEKSSEVFPKLSGNRTNFNESSLIQRDFEDLEMMQTGSGTNSEDNLSEDTNRSLVPSQVFLPKDEKENKFESMGDHQNNEISPIEEYRKISKIYEDVIEKQSIELAKLREECHRSNRLFTSTEMAFSDLYLKYQKSRATIEAYKENEDNLLYNIESAEDQFEKLKAKYEVMKNAVQDEVAIVERAVLREKQEKQAEIAKLQATVKRMQIKASSLENSLKQKTEECMALSAFWDDITASTHK
ncbi:MATH and LRR domain-containing protein PFE0570w-like isoform X2 [Sitophilus oryzae]|uniref:MATH and LRR domain-containing protein PFE0570w-like isoform X2 n=1 Tax=Sitophilus oryzae TaxID=7048 RepID=A0A6J2Y2Y5_SITOR|nr:MATH and LRR domain-containing protein PFE0570w-like isoform X2 [Sitophilus oryzae]